VPSIVPRLELPVAKLSTDPEMAHLYAPRRHAYPEREPGTPDSDASAQSEFDVDLRAQQILDGEAAPMSFSPTSEDSDSSLLQAAHLFSEDVTASDQYSSRHHSRDQEL